VAKSTLNTPITGGSDMSSRKEIQERRRKRKQQQRKITMMLITGVALIVVALLMLPTFRSTFFPFSDFVKPELNPRPMEDGTKMGDPNAPVTIEEFSDFGCSHCAAFAETTAGQIVKSFVETGDVQIKFHSVGALLNNPNTTLAAEAAYCAADQNKFWEYHDLVFANQFTLFANLSTDVGRYLTAFARYLNMDEDSFVTCLESGKYKEQISQDEIDATAAGVNSTPSFLINGTLVVGNMPYENFEQTINLALAEAANP
jgi:protein-disulfide isomerase/predicted nucleic acid-binding Zn ribbon protein